jgi:hypothetical protein
MGLYDNITYADDEIAVAPEEGVQKPNGVVGVVEEKESKKGVLKKLALHK